MLTKTSHRGRTTSKRWFKRWSWSKSCINRWRASRTKCRALMMYIWTRIRRTLSAIRSSNWSMRRKIRRLCQARSSLRTRGNRCSRRSICSDMMSLWRSFTKLKKPRKTTLNTLLQSMAMSRTLQASCIKSSTSSRSGITLKPLTDLLSRKIKPTTQTKTLKSTVSRPLEMRS